MTRVFVYHHLPDRLAAACGLVTQIFTQGKNIVVYAPDPERSQWIDRLLWTQSPLSFIPHCRADAPLASETPVVIAERPEQIGALAKTAFQKRLLNLDDDIPPEFARYENLIELVGPDDQDRRRARQRTLHYREIGCEIRFIDKTER